MQTDANLVLYDVNGKAIWATGTNTGDIAYAILQTDLNFVVYATGTHRWASKDHGGIIENGVIGAYVTLQDDGNLVEYIPPQYGIPSQSAVWSTNTQGSAGAQIVTHTTPAISPAMLRARLIEAQRIIAQTSSCTSAALSTYSQTTDDSTYVTQVAGCAQSIAANSSGTLSQTASQIETIIDLMLTGVIDFYLTTAICYTLGIGVATIGGAAIGSAVGLGVGAIVGAIIGAIVGGINSLLNPPPTCNITLNDLSLRGNPISTCAEYISNLTAAAAWIQANPGQLAGMTAVCLAKNFNIAVANVMWEAANSSNFGLSYTLSTAGADGSLFNMPGAFELLNRAQLGHAVGVVSALATQLSFFQTVVNPITTTHDGLYQDTNTWAPITPVNGQNIFPGFPGTGVAGGGLVYSAPQNLFTNDIIWSSCASGKQSNMPQGIYMLQAMYPMLTRAQCELVFATAEPVYQQNLQDAQNWANQQCPIPTVSQLRSASSFNLTAADAAAVIAAWNPVTTNLTGQKVNNCPAGGAGGGGGPGTGTTSTAVTVVKGASVVGGLGLISLALFAAHSGVSVPVAAKTLFSKAKNLLPKRVTRTTRRR
jgi:hypothetical protein